MYHWDLTASPPRATWWQAHSNDIQELAFSPDGRSLYSRDVDFPAAGNRSLKRWELTGSGARQQAEFKPSGNINGMALRSDGGALVCSVDAIVSWLDPITLQPAPGPNIPIGGRVCFSPDGRMLAVGRGKDITIFEAASGAEVRKLVDPQTGKAHEGPNLDAPSFLPGGAVLMSATDHQDDQTAKLWDIASGRLLCTVPLCVREARLAALSPDGRRLVTSGDGRVVDHEVGGLRELTSLGPQRFPLRAVDFSPDGLSLACMTTPAHDGAAAVWYGTTWRLATGEPLRSFSCRVPRRKGGEAVAFHPRGEALACGAYGAVEIWSLRADRPFPTFDAFPLSGLPTFDPDGQSLWGVVDESAVLAWRWPDGGVACRWENRGGAGLDSIYALAAGRRWVLAGGRDGRTRLLRAEDARPERKLAGPGAAVRAVALSPDESLAAAGTQQGIVRLYRLPGGEQVADLTEQRAAVEVVAFSPGGELLAAGGRDREVLLYDVHGAAVRLLVRLPCPGGTVQALRFHPDGDRLAIVVQGETAARVWHLGLLRRRLGEMGLAEGWPPKRPGRRYVGEDALSIAARGRQRIREGDVDVGLAWLALALRLAEQEGSPLGRDLRRELAAWCAEGEYRTIHTGPASVTAMAVSKDDREFAVAYGGDVRLYAPGGQVGPALSHPSPVLSLEFSPDGARLLSVSMEGAVRLWDRKAGSATIVQPSGVRCANFSPDGKVIACGGPGNHIRLYDGADGHDHRRGAELPKEVRHLTYRPDGRQLAVACAGSPEVLLNADLSLAGKFPVSLDTYALAYRPDGRALVHGTFTHGGTLWRCNSASLLPVGCICPQEGAVTTLAFDTSGKLLVSSSGDRVWLWDGDTGLPLGRALTPPAGASAVLPATADRPLLVGGVDGAVRAWSPPAPMGGSAEAISCLVALRTGLEAEPGGPPRELDAAALESRARRLRELGGPPVEAVLPVVRAAERGVGLCERGRRAEGLLWLARALELAPARDEPLVRRLRTQLAGWGGPAPVPRVVASSPPSSPQAAVLFSPDGKTLYAGGAKGSGGLWDIARGRWRWSVDDRAQEMNRSVAFSPDGALLAGHGNRTVSLRDAATGRLLASLPELTSRDPAIAFAPDGETFATGDDHGVRLWNTRTRAPRAALHRPDLQVTALAFSPEGGPLLVGTMRGLLALDPQTLAPTPRVWREASPIYAVVPLPGRRAAVGSGVQARLHRLPDLRPGPTLVIHGSGVVVAASRDGEVLATASHDTTARLLDGPSGLPLGPPLPHPAVVYTASVTPDGRLLATACLDRQIRLWEVPRPVEGAPARLRVWAEAFTRMELTSDGTVRELTDEERAARLARLAQLGGTPPGLLRPR